MKGVFRALGRALLRLGGWTVVGEPPEVDKYVVVVAPHTSNWDFPILLAAKWALGLDVGFIGKHTLFRGPGKWLFGALGGIPVDRSHPSHLVDQVVDAFRRADRLAIAIAPEGTRSYTDHWHSGFYRIAMAAGVPVVLAFIDYATKTAGIAGIVELTGDEEVDMARIAEAYAGKHGRTPGRFGPVRLGR